MDTLIALGTLAALAVSAVEAIALFEMASSAAPPPVAGASAAGHGHVGQVVREVMAVGAMGITLDDEARRRRGEPENEAAKTSSQARLGSVPKVVSSMPAMPAPIATGAMLTSR